jgi:hypothetical protein
MNEMGLSLTQPFDSSTNQAGLMKCEISGKKGFKRELEAIFIRKIPV